ncbi:MAG: type I CRISPR-associated protein Cas7 [Dehalococcoidia bacterium]|nr:type I CRISPR-associated protein Cas7 [Dehalococcoidia bacterium]
MTESNKLARATGLLVIEVRNSNPNGDPDRDSDPRQRSHDQRGLISPVSFKRKLRDLVEDKEGPAWQEFGIAPEQWERFDVLESRGRDPNVIGAEIKNGTFEGRYWDGRVFGNTFLEKDGEDSIRSGVAQFALGVSVAPVRVERMTLTNKAGVQPGKDRGMAPLGFRVVEHGVYCMPFYVNPTAATKSGCTVEDIELLLRLIPIAYPHTASAARPSVEIRHAWYVEHRSVLGSCPDFAILDALSPTKRTDVDQPSTSWSDYDVPTDLGELGGRVRSIRDLMVDE